MCKVCVSWVALLLVLATEHTTQSCILPEHPTNGRHKALEYECPPNTNTPECQSVPGTSVHEGWILFVTCNQGFTPENGTNSSNIPSVCFEGAWSSVLPPCVYNLANDPHKCILPPHPENGKFEPLLVECALEKFSGGNWHPGESVPSDCVLLYSCDEGYKLSSTNEQIITTCDNSSWTPEPDDIRCERTNTLPSITSLSEPVYTGCILPQEPHRRKYCSFQCEECNTTSLRNNNCSFTPGSKVPHNVVKVQCDQGFRFRDNQDYVAIVCVNQRWTPEVPECLELCPPLESDSVYARCFYGTLQVDCTKPMLPTTTATYQCKPSHTEYPSLTIAGVYKRILTCKYNGKWSNVLPECEPACGISKGENIIYPTIVGGKDTKLGVFPWHAGLYKRERETDNNDMWRNICGGSLISKNVVLTAAHCVVLLNSSDLRVGLGKYYRSWTQDEPNAVKRNVSAIRIPREYNGAVTTYAWDIALILLSDSVEINNFVMPVCRDVDLAYDITQNKTGYVVGWGKTVANGNESEILLHNDLTVIDYDVCLRRIPKVLAFDKFCGVKGSASVAERGDSGGGMTVLFNGLHYIFGIVSLKHNDLSVFTNVSWHTHKTWIENEIINFNRIIF